MQFVDMFERSAHIRQHPVIQHDESKVRRMSGCVGGHLNDHPSIAPVLQLSDDGHAVCGAIDRLQPVEPSTL